MGTIKVSVLEQDGAELDVPTEMDLAQAIDYVSSDTSIQAQLNSILESLAKTTRLKTTATLSNSSNVTFTNITALQLNLVAGKTYYLRGILAYTSAAVNTGLSWALDGTSNGTLSVIDTTASSRTAVQSYSAVAKAGVMTHTSSATNTSVEIATFDATYVCTASGTLYPKFRSEINNSAIVIQAGSIMECIEI